MQDLFDKQKQFQSLIGESTEFVTPYERMKKCNIMVRRAVDELNESLKEMPFDLSGYNKSKKILHFNQNNIHKELIDAQLFIINALNILGIDANEHLFECRVVQENNVDRFKTKKRFREETDNFLIIIEGPDGVGKTEICKSLSKKLGYPIMRMPDTDTKNEIEKYSQFYRKTILHINQVLILDRFYPSSIVYGQYFDREIPLEDIVSLHEKRQVFVFIIDCEKPFRSDNFIDENEWPEIREIYLQQAKANKWKIIKNNTTLDNCVQEIIGNLQF